MIHAALMPRLLFLQPFFALVVAFRVVQRGLGLALLVGCATAAAQAPAPAWGEWEESESSASWYAAEMDRDVDLALLDHPLVEHAVVDAADTQAWESDDLPRCHKPANPGGDTSLACEGGDIALPPRAAHVQLKQAPTLHTTVFPLAQPQHIVQPLRRPPRWA